MKSVHRGIRFLGNPSQVLQVLNRQRTLPLHAVARVSHRVMCIVFARKSGFNRASARFVAAITTDLRTRLAKQQIFSSRSIAIRSTRVKRDARHDFSSGVSARGSSKAHAFDHRVIHRVTIMELGTLRIAELNVSC